MKPIPELEGKNIAIIAMGNSQLDYHKMITHSKTFDEVWAINAMIGVLKRVDRAFVLVLLELLVFHVVLLGTHWVCFYKAI